MSSNGIWGHPLPPLSRACPLRRLYTPLKSEIYAKYETNVGNIPTLVRGTGKLSVYGALHTWKKKKTRSRRLFIPATTAEYSRSRARGQFPQRNHNRKKWIMERFRNGQVATVALYTHQGTRPGQRGTSRGGPNKKPVCCYSKYTSPRSTEDIWEWIKFWQNSATATGANKRR